MLKKISIIVFSFLMFCGAVLFSLSAQALQSTSYVAEDLRDSFSVSSSAYKSSERYGASMGQSPVQLVLPSFVIHGMQPDPSVAAAMPRRVVNSGDAVTTPGVGLEYKSPGGFLLLGAVIKDCFDDLAGTFQVGVNERINRDSDWGFTVGVYMRQTPLVCPAGATNLQSCYSVDGLTFKYVTYINGQPVDIIPLPFFHYSYNLYKSKDLQINFKVMANFVLNEFGIEIPL